MALIIFYQILHVMIQQRFLITPLVTLPEIGTYSIISKRLTHIQYHKEIIGKLLSLKFLNDWFLNF